MAYRNEENHNSTLIVLQEEGSRLSVKIN